MGRSSPSQIPHSPARRALQSRSPAEQASSPTSLRATEEAPWTTVPSPHARPSLLPNPYGSPWGLFSVVSPQCVGQPTSTGTAAMSPPPPMTRDDRCLRPPLSRETDVPDRVHTHPTPRSLARPDTSAPHPSRPAAPSAPGAPGHLSPSISATPEIFPRTPRSARKPVLRSPPTSPDEMDPAWHDRAARAAPASTACSLPASAAPTLAHVRPRA